MSEITPIANPRSAAQLAAALDDVRAAPRDAGAIELIVARPVPLRREVLLLAELHTDLGMIGDGWSKRPNKKLGVPNFNAQITVMNIRALRAICDTGDWPFAGDNLCVDLDLSYA